MVGRQFQKSVSRYCDSTGRQSPADQSLSIHQPEFNRSSSSWMPKGGVGTLMERRKAKAQRFTIQRLGWTSLNLLASFRSIRSSLGIPKLLLYMPCEDTDDMDVYVLVRKLDRDGVPLLNYNIPLKDYTW